MTCSYRWPTHTCLHTYTHRWAPKTATLGNGEFPKPQSAWEGEGSHGKAGCLHAVPLSEQTGPELKQTEQKRKRREQNNTHPDLAPNRWQHPKVQRLVSAIYPHAVVGQLASQSGRHVGRGRSITGLLPSWHSLGKPRWEYKVSVTSGNACNSTKSWGPWGSWEGGPARWKRLNSTVNQGETVSGSFYLMIWQKQTVESPWLYES